MGRYGYVALLVVCLGWFAYQSLRVAPQDDPATVVIWSGWGEQSPAFELYHQWWDELEREQGIKVTHVSLMNEVMIQQANRSLVLGGSPALFQSFGGFGLALQGRYGLLQDIRPEIKKRGWDKVLDQKWLDFVTFDGEFYGIPIEAATFGLLINKTLFDAHGIAYPEDWESFVAACEAFLAAGVQPLLAAGREENGYGPWLSTLHMRFAGADHYLEVIHGKTPFQNEAVAKAFDTFRQFYRQGYFGSQLLGMDWEGCRQSFYQGKGAMLYSGNWEAWGAINFAPQFDYRMFRFPTPPDGLGNEWDLLGGSNTTWVVPKNSLKHEATLAYLDMIADHERLKALANKIYYIVPLKETYLDSTNHPLHRSIAARAHEARQIYNNLNVAAAPAINRVYHQSFLAHALGRMDFDEASLRIQSAIDGYYARQQRRQGL